MKKAIFILLIFTLLGAGCNKDYGWVCGAKIVKTEYREMQKGLWHKDTLPLYTLENGTQVLGMEHTKKNIKGQFCWQKKIN